MNDRTSNIFPCNSWPYLVDEELPTYYEKAGDWSCFIYKKKHGVERESTDRAFEQFRESTCNSPLKCIVICSQNALTPTQVRVICGVCYIYSTVKEKHLYNMCSSKRIQNPEGVLGFRLITTRRPPPPTPVFKYPLRPNHFIFTGYLRKMR